MTTKRASALFRLLVTVFAFTLVAAACVSNDDDDEGATETGSTETEEPAEDDAAEDEPADEEPADAAEEEPADEGEDPAEEEPAEPVELTASSDGVTADSITVGVSMLDFAFLKDQGLSPNGWGDQQAVYEALFDHINAEGGINGRQVQAVYEFYSPTDGADAERACTALTQDNVVFAVLGGFLGPLAGTADPCITGTNDTPMVGGEITADELANSTAFWVTQGPTVETQTLSLLNLLVETGRTDGAQVFTMGGAAAADEEPFVLAELDARGIEVVGSAIIEAPDGDTIAQDAELSVAFERFRSSGANTLMIFGTPSAMIRGAGAAGLTGEIAMWSNDSGGLGNLGATIVDKSIADGTLVTTGRTDAEIWEDPAFQEECVAPVAERIPDADIRAPDSYAAGEENWFNSVRLYCFNVDIFTKLATAAGPDLTPETLEAAAFGAEFDDFYVPGRGNSSFSENKLGAGDDTRLSTYDSTVGDGALVPVTELFDAFP